MSANISTAIANRAMEWGLGSLSLSRDSGYHALTFKAGSFLCLRYCQCHTCSCKLPFGTFPVVWLEP